MSNARTYTRAPIVEAILDIQVDLPSDFRVETLLKCVKNLKSEYPNQKNAQYFESEFTLGPKMSSTMSTESAGYIFSTTDNLQLFQAKRTGFTFNRLSPYLGWNQFINEAKKLWDVYRQVTHPKGYKRIALRYINRFDFPLISLNMETYFRTYPEISRDLPQVMSGFFFQTHVPMIEVQSTATITQTIVESKGPGITSIILDIDLYRVESLPSGSELWAEFDKLRICKNRIFEASITEATREVIR